MIAGIARACLLLRGEINEETWMMVPRAHEDYAERFGATDPRSGVYLDCQTEENAWTVLGRSGLALSRPLAP